MTARNAPLFAHTVGLDYDVRRWQSRAGRPSGRGHRRSNAIGMPFDDAYLDVVICAQVYEHVPNDVPLFAGIYRAAARRRRLFQRPNWLSPVELHDDLPVLHWLPQAWANRLFQALGPDDQYYGSTPHLGVAAPAAAL